MRGSPKLGKPGFVYILRSPALRSSIVKIGATTRTPERRAFELAGATGVPQHFEVLYEELVVDCELAERLIHRDLQSYRIRRDREFFDVPLKLAVKVVFQTCLELNSQFAADTSRLALVLNGKALPADALKDLFKRYRGGSTRVSLVFNRSGAQAELHLDERLLITCTPDLLLSIGRTQWIESYALVTLMQDRS